MPNRTDALLVLCPLTVEALSVRSGLKGGRVVWAGMRAWRRSAVCAVLRRGPRVPVAVVGVACALTPHARPGDLVVPDVVRSPRGARRCSSSTKLVSALRAAGRTVHTGALVESERIVGRAADTTSDAVALDLESGLLLDLVDDGRPVTVLRAVVDTPARPLLSAATVPGGVAALAALRASGPALRTWATTVARGNDNPVKEVRHP